ncbi:MAG: type I restriction enzyme HsdR N-terminal domain-containing protein [Chloroflexi bacterium]|nr:type I restriction enzyme HsdR N-terminal domain-containing protein [Chloroflexota bacterium]
MTHEAPQDTHKTSKAAPTVPKWETDARERIKAELRQAGKILPALIEGDAVEANTRVFVHKFLCDGLGFDPFADLTGEYQVKGEFADYGVRIDKQLVAFVEIKRVTTKLAEKHLAQVKAYAINEGVEWAILTNGQHWQVYHLEPKNAAAIVGGPLVDVTLTIEVDLLGDETPSKKTDKLLLITKDSWRKHQIDELWKARRATSPRSLARVLCSEAVLDALRKELKKQTGHTSTPAELASLLRTTVIRPDSLA